MRRANSSGGKQKVALQVSLIAHRERTITEILDNVAPLGCVVGSMIQKKKRKNLKSDPNQKNTTWIRLRGHRRDIMPEFVYKESEASCPTQPQNHAWDISDKWS